MNSIQKIMLSAAAFSMMLGGCSDRSGSAGASGEDGKISIVSTIFAPYDFARQIAGDKANVIMLLPPASESHSFEPTAKNMIDIQNCDLFLYIGGESESWADKILGSADSGGKSLRLIETVSPVTEEIVEGMEHGHDHDEEHEEHDHDEEHAEHDHDEEHDEHDHDEANAEYDEHIWTSPLNAKKMVQAISETVCEIDPENADYYKANTEAYLKQLDELDGEFRAVVGAAERKTLLFGDRFPFRYFTDEYGLEYYAAFPGCSAESEPGAQTITFLIKKAEEEKIPVILCAEMSNGKIANTIAEPSGAKVLTLHSCHNVTRDEFLGEATYLELMKGNVEVLRQALA